MNRGDTAPFDGQLLNEDLAISLGQTATHAAEHLQLELARSSSVANARLNAARAVAAAETNQMRRERDAFAREGVYWREEAARKVEPSPWWTSPFFVVPVVVLATVGAIYLGAEIRGRPTTVPAPLP